MGQCGCDKHSWWRRLMQITVEIEAKAKELAVLKLKEKLYQLK